MPTKKNFWINRYAENHFNQCASYPSYSSDDYAFGWPGSSRGGPGAAGV
jgi:hypothetical protein